MLDTGASAGTASIQTAKLIGARTIGTSGSAVCLRRIAGRQGLDGIKLDGGQDRRARTIAGPARNPSSKCRRV